MDKESEQLDLALRLATDSSAKVPVDPKILEQLNNAASQLAYEAISGSSTEEAKTAYIQSLVSRAIILKNTLIDRGWHNSQNSLLTLRFLENAEFQVASELAGLPVSVAKMITPEQWQQISEHLSTEEHIRNRRRRLLILAWQSYDTWYSENDGSRQDDRMLPWSIQPVNRKNFGSVPDDVRKMLSPVGIRRHYRLVCVATQLTLRQLETEWPKTNSDAWFQRKNAWESTGIQGNQFLQTWSAEHSQMISQARERTGRAR